MAIILPWFLASRYSIDVPNTHGILCCIFKAVHSLCIDKLTKCDIVERLQQIHADTTATATRASTAMESSRFDILPPQKVSNKTDCDNMVIKNYK